MKRKPIETRFTCTKISAAGYIFNKAFVLVNFWAYVALRSEIDTVGLKQLKQEFFK